MWKLAAALLAGAALLFSQGCCWPYEHEHYRHHHGDWDDQRGYERVPAPRPWRD